MRHKRIMICGLLAACLASTAPSAAVNPDPSDPFGCDKPVPKVYPSTADPTSYPAFLSRDVDNQQCGYQRVEDQLSNPAFMDKMRSLGPNAFLANVSDALANLSRPKLTAAQLIPFAQVADPFRTGQEWSASGRGRFQTVRFVAANTQVRLAGDIFLPPANVTGPYPGVVIATGSSQQFRQEYYWAAEGLAEEGYEVLVFDFQGQGGSETFDRNSDGSPCMTQACGQDAFPPELYFSYGRFYDQLRDAIRFFFSTPSSPYGTNTPNYSGTNNYNPAYASLNTSQVGLAGHSVGAVAANDVGQDDQRIKAIVRWGYTGYVSPEYVSKVHAPTLIMSPDYGEKGPEPYATLPAPGVPELGYQQLLSFPQTIDAMLISQRASTHYEWAYVGGRYASRYGERVAFHYSLAWFDAYLKGLTDSTKRNDAFTRLTASSFNGSSDAHSIGAGTSTLDLGTGRFINVPYRIAGQRVCDRISYIFKSAYRLQGGGLRNDDMRSGC